MNQRPQRGFTLIETLVAITIVTFSIVAPFAAVQKVIRATNLSRDQLIASSLAQEGVEYIRFVRYSNWLADGQNPAYDPLTGLDECNTTDGCTIDATDALATAISGCSGTCPFIRVSSNGIYTYKATLSSTPTTATPYTRKITVSTSAGPYAIVTSTVTWKDKSTTRSIVITEHLYDWL